MTPVQTARIVAAVVESLLRDQQPSDWESRRIPLEHAALFEGRCGHRWIADSGGWYACPVCGDYDGDHHLRSCALLAELLPEGRG